VVALVETDPFELRAGVTSPTSLNFVDPVEVAVFSWSTEMILGCETSLTRGTTFVEAQFPDELRSRRKVGLVATTTSVIIPPRAPLVRLSLLPAAVRP
jgi:hypothetical protein